MVTDRKQAYPKLLALPSNILNKALSLKNNKGKNYIQWMQYVLPPQKEENV